MRTFILVFCTAVFSLNSDNGFSQDADILIRNNKSISVEEIFELIKSQTDYDFVFNIRHIKDAPYIAVEKGIIKAGQLLKKGLDPINCTYEFTDNTVIVKRKETIGFTAPIQDTYEISGVITDEEGNPVPGITVYVSNGEPTDKERYKNDFVIRGTSTNFDGSFTLEVSLNHYLGVTGLGYEFYYEKLVDKNKKTFNIVLKESVSQLEEVVISTGYYTTAKGRTTGSITRVDSEEIGRQVTTNIQDRFEGIVPGLTINTANRTQNDLTDPESQIILRGASSFQAGNGALIVVDGFPIEGGLESINPNDIQSIDILQDAAATSIWGVRASNGVIVITTKKGRPGQMSIEFSSFLSVQERPDLNDLGLANSEASVNAMDNVLQGGVRFPRYSPFLANNSALDAVSTAFTRTDFADPTSVANYEAILNQLRGTDVLPQFNDYLFRSGFEQQYNLSIRTGGERNNMYFSLSHNDNESTTLGNSLQRQILNFKDTYKITDKFTFDFGGNFSLTRAENNGDGSNLLSESIIPRFQAIVDANGNPIPIARGVDLDSNASLLNQGYLDWTYNPITELNANDRTSTATNLRVQGGLTWELLKGFTAEIKGQYEWERAKSVNNSSLDTWRARDFINARTGGLTDGTLAYNIPLGGIYDATTNSVNSYYIRANANYNYTFNDVHAVTALVGVEYSERKFDQQVEQLFGYNEQNASFNNLVDWASLVRGTYEGTLPIFRFGEVNPNTFAATDSRLASTFANVAYTYDRRYTLNASIKRDQSNRVGEFELDPNSLWSVGLAWNLTNESFLENSSNINLLKLRGTYGLSGNIAIGPDVTSLPTLVPFNNLLIGSEALQINTFGNPFLTFEDTEEINIGLDFGFFNNRINGFIEYYNEDSKNLLSDIILPSTTGFNAFFGNNGRIVNKGVTLNLNTRIIDAADFKWETSINATYNDSEVKSYELAVTDPTFLVARLGGISSFNDHIEGERVGTVLSFRSAGLDDQGRPTFFDTDGSILPYETEVSSIDALEVSGTTIAPYYGGLTNNFRYKNFNLGVILSFEAGHVFRKPTVNFQRIASSTNNGTFNSDLENAFVAGVNEDTNIPVIPATFSDAFSNAYFWHNFSDIFIEDASHVRLRQVSLDYNFSKALLEKLKLKGLSLNAQARDLGLLWTANDLDIDPRALPYGSNSFGTLRTRPSYTLGLKVQF